VLFNINLEISLEELIKAVADIQKTRLVDIGDGISLKRFVNER